MAGALTGDPHLSPLQNNGGLKLTHIPLEGSIVLSTGSYGELPKDVLDFDGDGNTNEPVPFDQRGIGYFRAINGTVDLGAVQVQPIDTDGDGIPDSIELAFGTDPNNPDSDGDGIPDGMEDANRNGTVDDSETDPRLADTDGDGYSDGDEVAAGTNPLDNQSFPLTSDGDIPMMGPIGYAVWATVLAAVGAVRSSRRKEYQSASNTGVEQ